MRDSKRENAEREREHEEERDRKRGGGDRKREKETEEERNSQKNRVTEKMGYRQIPVQKERERHKRRSEHDGRFLFWLALIVV